MLKRVSVIVLAVVICATFIAFIGCDKAKRSSPNTPKGPEGVKAMMQRAA